MLHHRLHHNVSMTKKLQNKNKPADTLISTKINDRALKMRGRHSVVCNCIYKKKLEKKKKNKKHFIQ